MIENEIDKAWVLLGRTQIEILRDESGLTRSKVADRAIQKLGPETQELYGLESKSIFKLANTSIAHCVQLGIVEKKAHKYWMTNQGMKLDLQQVTLLLENSITAKQQQDNSDIEGAHE